MSPILLIELSFDETSHETVEVTEVAPNQFRLHYTPVLADPPVYLGDLIEARPDSKGVYHFQRLVEPSGYRVHSWFLPREVAESEDLVNLKRVIETLGGTTEQIFGGWFITHLPADAPLNADDELKAVVARVKARSAK